MTEKQHTNITHRNAVNEPLREMVGVEPDPLPTNIYSMNLLALNFLFHAFLGVV